MPKILILCTGGTIGMQSSERGYLPLANFVEILEQKLVNYGDQQLPDYHIMKCDPLIDSANLQLSDWSKIANIIKEAWHSYQGFIILHGTDTMAYSASALSFIFSQLGNMRLSPQIFSVDN